MDCTEREHQERASSCYSYKMRPLDLWSQDRDYSYSCCTYVLVCDTLSVQRTLRGAPVGGYPARYTLLQDATSRIRSPVRDDSNTHVDESEGSLCVIHLKRGTGRRPSRPGTRYNKMQHLGYGLQLGTTVVRMSSHSRVFMCNPPKGGTGGRGTGGR